MIKYNLDKLIKVELKDYTEEKDMVYKYGKKHIIPMFNVERGFYQRILSYEYIGQNVPNITLFKGKCFRFPRVRLHFQDGYFTQKYFENYNDAVLFYEEITKGKKWLKN